MKVNFSKFMIFFILSCTCCKIDDRIKDPADYEDYITISADQYAAVSPDGKWIAYYHISLEYPGPEDYPKGLYIMDFEGINRRLLLKGGPFAPKLVARWQLACFFQPWNFTDY
jgi:hypothetical protein